MSKKNYTNYAKKQNAPVQPKAVEEVVEVVEEVVLEDIPVVEEVVEEVKAPVVGVVVDCKKLNVRKAPNPIAAVVCEIMENTEVKIDEANSTVEFFKVTLASGMEGFCMKKYISVRQ